MVRPRLAAGLPLLVLVGCLHSLDELPLVPCQVDGSCAPGFACDAADLFCHAVSDAGVDGGKSRDAGLDSGIDAGTDAGLDAGPDAGFDAGLDAGTDGGFDAGPTCSTPATPDGGIEPRAWFGLAVDEDDQNLVLIGGEDGCLPPLNNYVLLHTDCNGGVCNAQFPTFALASGELAIGQTAGFFFQDSTNQKLFVFGGSASSQAQTLALSFNLTSAIQVGDDVAPLPVPLAWMGLAPFPIQQAPGPDTLFFLAGGESTHGASDALLLFDPLGADGMHGFWYQLSDLPTARAYPGAAIGPDDLLYAVGGQDSTGALVTEVDAFNVSPACLDDAGVLDGGILGDGIPSAACGWSSGGSLPTPRTDLAVVTGPDGLIYAIGGVSDAGVSGVVEAYDTDAGVWITAPALVTPRHGHAAAVANGAIWVLGGIDATGAFIGSVEEYDPATATGWVQTSQ